MRSIWDKIKEHVWAAVAVVLLLLVGAFWPQPAKAADNNKQGKIAATNSAFLPDLTNIGKIVGPWSGLYVGAYGGHAIGELSGDINDTSDGQIVLGAVGFNVQSGRIVWGPEVSYGWVFGSLNDAGIDNILNVGGRVGVLANDNLLFYGHGSWSRLYTSTSVGEVDGWQFGPGVEFKVGPKLSVDLRYSYGIWDVDHPCLDIDATSHVVMAGVKVSF